MGHQVFRGAWYFGTVVLLVFALATPARAAKGRASGSGAVIVYDGSRDVSIQQGSGESSALSALQLASLDDFAVLARLAEGNGPTDLPKTTGAVPAMQFVRLLIFTTDEASLIAACTGAALPTFCDSAHYTTVELAVGVEKFNDPTKFYVGQDDRGTDVRDLIRNRRLVQFALVQSGTAGVWKLSPADRAIVAAMQDRFGAQNLHLGFSADSTGTTILETVNLALAPTATAYSHGPQGTGLLASLPLVPVLDLDAGAGSTLYAAPTSGALQISQDGGHTWIADADPRRVRQLAVNRSDLLKVLAVYEQATSNPNVARSTDGGGTWTQLLTLPAAALAQSGIAWATFDPFVAGRIYAFGAGRFLTSNDNGDTWASTTPGVTLGEPAFSPTAGTFYSVSSNPATRGVWKTTNSGATWTKLSLTLSTALQPFVVHSRQTSAVYVAEAARVYTSHDGGATWTGSDVLAGATITSLAVDAGTCSSCHPSVFAGTDRGLYVGPDGASWFALLKMQPGIPYTKVTAIVPGEPVIFGTEAGTWVYDPNQQIPSHLFDEAGGWGMLALPSVSAATAVADATSWIQVVNVETTPTGETTVVYRVLPRAAGAVEAPFDEQPRTGYITVGGRTFAVGQPAIGCSYTLGSTSLWFESSGGGSSVTVTTNAQCPWSALSNAAWVTLAAPVTREGPQTLGYTVAPNPGTAIRQTTIELAGQSFIVSQLGLPTIVPTRTSLRFAAAHTGSAFVFPPQHELVRITQQGTGTLPWAVSVDKPWLTVTPASGTGTLHTDLNVGVVFSSSLPTSGTVTGVITIRATGDRSDVLSTITVTLQLTPSGPPFGVLDTPQNNTTGVTGSIAVTGWALDDVGVTRVRIVRDPADGETGLIYIGDAARVEGARGDIVSLYPGYPQVSRGGWGYLLLTNFLPNGGTGTFRLHAYADDAAGNSTLLGSTTIVCTNDVATLPFGAIDTPGQGETVSGVIGNFGWVLSPGTRRADPPNGTVTVLIDGVAVGSPSGWASRSDLTALFPAAKFAGVTKALGLFGLDTTTLTNGVHSIAWIVQDNVGGAQGVGSRFFTVSNGSGQTRASQRWLTDVSLPAMRVVHGRRGFDMNAPLRPYTAGDDGRVVIQSEELDRVELELGAGARGYMRTPSGDQPLPAGSRIDTGTGTFTWQPGPGFIGAYDFQFDNGRERATVRIVLNPKGSDRAGVQTVIDVPRTKTIVGSRFMIGGWAADLDSPAGAGIATVHIWAYPSGGGTPVFLGVADHDGERPDVAAVYGDRFLRSGYGLIAGGLEAGEYDIAVFAFSTARQRFMPARIVHVSVSKE